MQYHEPGQPEDKVWLSREEYDRLRTAANNQPVQQPVFQPQPPQPMAGVLNKVEYKSRNNSFYTWFSILSIAAGIFLFLSLMTHSFGILFAPAMTILFALAVVSVVMFFVENKEFKSANKIAQQNGYRLTRSGGNQIARTTAIVMVVLIGIAVLVPILFILFILLLFTLGGGRGS